MAKLAKGIAVESSSKLSHNLPSSMLLNVDVTASGIKQSLIFQLNKLYVVKLVLWKEGVHSYTYKNESCICVKLTFLFLPLSCLFYSLFLEN
jgi:hypothetical protein